MTKPTSDIPLILFPDDLLNQDHSQLDNAFLNENNNQMSSELRNMEFLPKSRHSKHIKSSHLTILRIE
jgi:hypothetical protein